VPASFEACARRGKAASQKEESGETPFQGISSGISLRNVTFFYKPGENLLENVSLTVPKGSHVAVIGRSGEGKTTLVDLLSGLLSPVSGRS